jgi:hypothetical protein
MNLELWQKVDGFVRERKLHRCHEYLLNRLRQESTTRFKSLLHTDFSNDPKDVGEKIEYFITSQTIEIKAVYLEMNGFDINPDRWYFDFFGYRKYTNDPDNVDWLCEWNTEYNEPYELTGLEQTMADYDWYSHQDGYTDQTETTAEEIAMFLVMIKYARLIKRALAQNDHITIPVLATAHDFDIIPRFNENNCRQSGEYGELSD